MGRPRGVDATAPRRRRDGSRGVGADFSGGAAKSSTRVDSDAEFRHFDSFIVFLQTGSPPDLCLTQPLQSGNASQVSEEKACGAPRFPPRPPAASPRLRRGVDATTPRRPRDHTAASTPLPSQTRPPRDPAGRGPRRDSRDEATGRRATRGDVVAAASPRRRAMGPASRIVAPAPPSLVRFPPRTVPAPHDAGPAIPPPFRESADSRAAAAANPPTLRPRRRRTRRLSGRGGGGGVATPHPRTVVVAPRCAATSWPRGPRRLSGRGGGVGATPRDGARERS